MLTFPGLGQRIETLVERGASRFELGDHRFRQARARDATLHFMRVAQILGQ